MHRSLQALAGASLALATASAQAALPADIAGASEANLQLWVRADAGLTTDASNRVSTWADASANANNGTQATLAKQPIATLNVLNGKPSIRFDGSDDVFSLPNSTLPTGNSSYSVFVVVNSNVAASMRGYIGGGTAGSTNQYNGFRFDNALAANSIENYWWGADMVSSANTVTNNVPYSINYTYNNASGRTIRKFGASVGANGGTSRNATSGNNVLGASYLAGADNWSGDIFEVIVYGRALSDAERSAVENYLALKYAIGISASATPSVASGASGVGNYVLGSTGAAVTFTAASTASGSLSATKSSTDPGSAGFSATAAKSNDGTNITPTWYATDRSWAITASSITGYTYSVALDATSAPGVTNPDRLVILKRANNSAAWTAVPTTRIGNTLHAAGLTSFSEFTIGGDSTALPVTLSKVATE